MEIKLSSNAVPIVTKRLWLLLTPPRTHWRRLSSKDWYRYSAVICAWFTASRLEMLFWKNRNTIT